MPAKVRTRKERKNKIVRSEEIKNRFLIQECEFYLSEQITLPIGLPEIIAKVVIFSWDSQFSELIPKGAGLLKETMCKINCHITYVLEFPNSFAFQVANHRDRSRVRDE